MTASADLAFVNGAVYTVDPARPLAQAIAVRDGRIVAVGSDDDVRELVGSSTDVIDLKGRMLLPGFQDAHVHPPSSGLEMLRCNLSNAYSLPDYRRIVAEYAAGHPDEPWILGGGWSMDVFPGGNPPKGELDTVVTDRPVYLTSRDGHSAWVNSKAVEIAGLSRDTPQPEDGVIVRGPGEEIWGTLHEGAVGLVERFLPEDRIEDWIEGLRVAQAYLHSLGITGWQDAIVGIDSVYRTFEAYLRFARDGELTARVIGALWWDRHRDAEQIDDLLTARERGSAGRFAATSVKIMQDGVVENFTAGMLEPYLDADGNPTDNRGKSFVDPEELKAPCHTTRRRGVPGPLPRARRTRGARGARCDRGSARRTNGMNDLRHHLAHIQVVHPDDLPRFRELGVVANAQPLWAAERGRRCST